MQKFVARQPIFDSQENIFGYELLFRSGLENYFKCDNPDQATSTVIADSFLLFGIETLTGGRNAFLNFTNDLILKKYATILPQQQVVIEILETVDPSPELVSACRKLKDKGYRLALDDFEYRPDYDPLIDLAYLIKIDIRKTPIHALKELKKQLNGKNIPLLAEKVETREEFRAAREFGFQYFQGYFFGQPETFATKEIPGCKLNYLLLVKEINAEKPDLVKIEDIVKREPMICYKLFRYLNSPVFAFNREILSIRHALVMLGLDEVRKWISIVSLAAMGADKPSALIVELITRAKFCEKIAPLIDKQNRSLDLFMMGLLSMINTVLDNSLDQVLNNVAASEDVKIALLEGDGPLKSVLDLLVAAEKGQWKDIAMIASSMGISEETAIGTYLEAIKWGNEILQMEQAAKEQKITI